MEQRLTMVTLGVADLAASTQFYEEKFGWKKLGTSNENITFFQLNGIILSLFPKEKLAEDATTGHEGSGFKTFTLAYNTRTQEEVDEVVGELKAKGVKVIKDPQPAVWGGYSGYVADLDDNLWEIAFNPFLKLDENGNTHEPY